MPLKKKRSTPSRLPLWMAHMDEREYTLVEHLADLRVRLVRAVMGLGLFTIIMLPPVPGIGQSVAEMLLEMLRAPMVELLRIHSPNAHFQILGVADYILCQMKAAMVAGVFLSSPWWLYQVWLFVAPGLYEKERRYVTWFVWAGALCFCGGAVFAYFAVFPTMFEYLVKSVPADLMLNPSLEEHFSFTLKMLLAFGLVFQTPVVIFILSMAGIVDPEQLGGYRKYVIVGAFVLGAVLTPTPDFLSQTLLAGPMIVLFEVGVFVSRMTVRVAGRPLQRKGKQPTPTPAEPQT
jgi:sec-independent protein translocase protein TatC